MACHNGNIYHNAVFIGRTMGKLENRLQLDNMARCGSAFSCSYAYLRYDSEKEKKRFTEEQAEEKITYLLYCELQKGVEKYGNQ